MKAKINAVVLALVLAGLAGVGYLAVDRLLWPKPRTIAELDLSLPGISFETAAEGGGYGRYAFPARRRLALDAAPWRNGDSSRVDLPDSRELLLPYAGLGLGPFQLSMDLMRFDLDLDKDKSSRKARAFAGIGYRPSPDLTLTLEYRALAHGAPLFAIDLGSLDLDLDHPFGSQTVTVNLSYRM